MKHLLLATVSLALASTLGSQNTVVSPPGFENKTGGRFSWGVGAYANGRSQLMDGNLRGNATRMTGVSFRLTSPTSGYYNAGRSWQTVQLDMAECDLSRVTGTFSTNATTTPTRVFSSAVSLPFVTGRHVSVPAPWSFHFPFRTVWPYTGSGDLLADFDFHGGSLTNGKSWGTNIASYLWDAAPSSGIGYGVSREFGNSGPSGCSDSSSQIPSLSARTNLLIKNHNPRDRFHPLAGRLVVDQRGIRFAPRLPAILVLGLRALNPGIPYPGVTCNRIHIDFSVPSLATLLLTDSGGNLPLHHPVTTRAGIVTNPAWVGQQVVVQGLWNDSRTGQVKLSSAAHTNVPALPPFLPSLAAIHSPNKTSGTPTSNQLANPVRRYTTR